MLSFLSRLHPLLVHLPIGLLSFSLLLSLLPASRRVLYGPAWRLSIALSAVASLFACATGYLLRQSDAYDGSISSWHQWAGISTCIGAWAAWVWVPWRRYLVWLASACMVVAGHLGGTLTHGEGYLFSSETSALQHIDTGVVVSYTAAVKATDTLSVSHPFRDEVSPILRRRCASCHSSLKQKGGLRLDGEAWIQKGGKNGPVVLDGDRLASPLYVRLLLPLSDEKHMPPKGKHQLTRAELAALYSWVASGAPFGPVTRPVVDTLGSVPLAVTDALEEGEGLAVEEPLSMPVLPSMPAPDTAAILFLQQRGVIIQEVMTGSHGLYVSLLQADKVDESLMQAFNRLREQAIEVRAGGTSLADAFLLGMPAFPQLRRLDLSRTQVTEAGLRQMDRFPALEVLNLYGTAVGDGVADALSPCRKLKKVYLWRTAVTEAGFRRLRSSLPALDADGGSPMSLGTTQSK